MERLTINFFSLEDGSVKAVVYEGTNRYMFEAIGMSRYGAMLNVATQFAFYVDSLNESLSRRAE